MLSEQLSKEGRRLRVGSGSGRKKRSLQSGKLEEGYPRQNKQHEQRPHGDKLIREEGRVCGEEDNRGNTAS
jgi:hypothetical protein